VGVLVNSDTEDTAVVGEDRDAGRMAAALAKGRSIVVAGSLGTGKTHLLRAVAARLRAQGHEPRLLRAGASTAVAALAAVLDRDPATPRTEGRAIVIVDDVDDLDPVAVEGLVHAVLDERATALLGVTPPRGLSSDHDESLSAAGRAMELWLRGAADRLDLSGLTRADACALMTGFGGGCLDTVTRSHIIAAADGSRLLLRELTIAALEAARTGRDPVAALDSAAIPGRLADAFAAHSSHLDHDQRATIGLLGLLPRVPYADAQRIVALDVLDDLLRVGLVREDGTPDRRLSVNALLARVARHGDAMETIENLLRAAKRAMLHEDAGWWSPTLARRIATTWHRGRSLAPDQDTVPPAVRARVWIDAARLANDAGDSDLGAAFARHGLRVTDAIEMRMELSYAKALGGAAVDLGEIARALMVEPQRPQLILRWQQMLTTLPHYPSDAVATLEEAGAIASPQHAELALSAAHGAVMGMRWSDALACAATLSGGAIVPASVRMRGAIVAAVAHAALGHVETADAELLRARRLFGERTARRSLATIDRVWALCAELYATVLCGRGPEAVIDALQGECDAAAREGDDLAMAAAGLTLAAASAFAGEEDRALRELSAAMHRARLPMFSPWLSPLAVVVAWTLGARGRAVDARHVLDLVDPDRSRQTPFIEHFRLSAQSCVLAAEGRREAALADARAAVALADSTPALLTLDLFHLTALGGGDDVVLARSRRLAETSTTPFAQQLYEAALDITAQRTTGAEPTSGAVMSTWESVRQRGGADGRGTDGARADTELTRREREIALLIEEGLSNRQIAGRLYLSVRTVESHVFQARAKTGASSRAVLGALVARSRHRADDATGT
jgi:DNA-binding CsgD family transcriptional regulator